MRLDLIKRGYFALFHFVAQKRITRQDVDLRCIHAHLLTVLTTGIMMWAYVWLSAISMSQPLPVVISFLASLVHTLSPLLFRYSKNVFFITSLMLLAGMSHQVVSAVYSGGFNSHILLWLGILPSLAGIIIGMSGLIFWTVITLGVCTTLLSLSLAGYQFPGGSVRYLSLLPQAFLVYGWISINTLMMYAHLRMQRAYQRKLAEKQANVSLLFKVLTHDISAPIASMSMASVALKQANQSHILEAVKVVENACENIIDITRKVRKLYEVDDEKYGLNTEPYCLTQCAEELAQLFSRKMSAKSITLSFDKTELNNIWVKVVPTFFIHEVMGNLLSNAIKFSYRGGEIRIKVRVVDGMAQIAVEDDGQGIPQDKQQALLQFGQYRSSNGTEAEQGLGYGFSIAKAFAKKFHGHVSIESPIMTTSGCTTPGTRVILSLPMMHPA